MRQNGAVDTGTTERAIVQNVSPVVNWHELLLTKLEGLLKLDPDNVTKVRDDHLEQLAAISAKGMLFSRPGEGPTDPRVDYPTLVRKIQLSAFGDMCSTEM